MLRRRDGDRSLSDRARRTRAPRGATLARCARLAPGTGRKHRGVVERKRETPRCCKAPLPGGGPAGEKERKRDRSRRPEALEPRARALAPARAGAERWFIRSVGDDLLEPPGSLPFPIARTVDPPVRDRQGEDMPGRTGPRLRPPRGDARHALDIFEPDKRYGPPAAPPAHCTHLDQPEPSPSRLTTAWGGGRERRRPVCNQVNRGPVREPILLSTPGWAGRPCRAHAAIDSVEPASLTRLFQLFRRPPARSGPAERSRDRL